MKDETVRIREVIERQMTESVASTTNEFYSLYQSIQEKAIADTINVLCNIYDFVDNETYEAYGSGLINGGFIYNEVYMMIVLVLTAVNGVLTMESEQTLQHELHHYYEWMMNNKQDTLSKRYHDMYVTSIDRENKDRHVDEWDEDNFLILQDALYRCFDKEINANLNEFEVYVRRNYGLPVGNINELGIYHTSDGIDYVLSKWDDFASLVGKYFKQKSYIAYNLIRNAEGRYIRGYRQKMIDSGVIELANRNWYGPWQLFFDELEDNKKEIQKRREKYKRSI